MGDEDRLSRMHILGAQGLPGPAKSGGDADISGGMTRGDGAVNLERTWGIRIGSRRVLSRLTGEPPILFSLGEISKQAPGTRRERFGY